MKKLKVLSIIFLLLISFSASANPSDEQLIRERQQLIEDDIRRSLEHQPFEIDVKPQEDTIELADPYEYCHEFKQLIVDNSTLLSNSDIEKSTEKLISNCISPQLINKLIIAVNNLYI